MSEFGIEHVWNQGDFVTRAVAVILMVMSIMSWCVIIIKFTQGVGLNKVIKRSKAKFWKEKNLTAAINVLGDEHFNPMRELAMSGHAVMSHQHHKASGISQQLDISDLLARALKNSIDDTVTRLQAGMGILASIGSTAPFVGLLGTVWGIYHALESLSLLDQPDIAHIAGPVGEALIMTAFGLFVAIPAVLGFNAISRRNRGYQHSIAVFAHDLHAYYLTGARMVIDPADLQRKKSVSTGQVQPFHADQSL
ncbi:MotA/TolQ/ExbB proton channel family protein [Sodalis sp. RH16]|uniref:MotA/TolQ/ExbB proton channel family protein n=1 Tax=Sodalis sp. RH16 TaxID=3394331 RepID=UPI0039B3A2B3